MNKDQELCKKQLEGKECTKCTVQTECKEQTECKDHNAKCEMKKEECSMYKSECSMKKEECSMKSACNALPAFDIKSISATGNGEQVDVVIVGAGPAGYPVAVALANQGLKTVVIEKAHQGGTCVNEGCIPTKTLLKSAHALEDLNKASEFGIEIKASEAKVNWNKIQERKRGITNAIRANILGAITSTANLEIVKDEATVLDKHNVKVGSRVFTTKIIILATGSSSIMLPLEGFADAVKANILIDSTGALELNEIPKSLVIIGGGAIGIEFASLYSAMGSKVTIIEGGPSILGNMDEDIKKLTHENLVNAGVKIITGAAVKSMKGNDVYFEKDSKLEKVSGDKVLLSIGRRPNNLGLDKTLGIKVSPRGGVEVNEVMQTSIPNIFAIGDVTGQIMLTHTAYKNGQVLLNYLAGRSGKEIVYNKANVPAVVFTYPEIGTIGKTEQQLVAENADFIKIFLANGNVPKAIADGNTNGFTKLLINKLDGQILGVHLVNKDASAMLSELAVAFENDLTVYDVVNTIHPHPTISEAIYYASLAAKTQLLKLKK